MLPVTCPVRTELISVEYAALNAELHRLKPSYGRSGDRYASVVLTLAARLETRSVLDYGAGKGSLAKALPFPIQEYDPAIPEKSARPQPADLVVCTDVLEHVEPERLPVVLTDLRRVTRQLLFCVVPMGPAQKSLPDGRNAHLIQQHAAWWCTSIGKFFTITGLAELPALTLVTDQARLAFHTPHMTLFLLGVPR